MEKRAEAFRSIGEVANLIGVAPHVLRYWETQFSQLKPMKRPDGRRYYRPDDVYLAAGLCEVLRDDGLTIRGARKLIAGDRGRTLRERGAARLKAVLPPPGEQGETKPGNTYGFEPYNSAGSSAAPPPPATNAAAKMETSSRSSEPNRVKLAPRAASLPLFPELEDPQRPDVELLQKLVSLTARLRETETLLPPARRQAALLQQAIAGLG